MVFTDLESQGKLERIQHWVDEVLRDQRRSTALTYQRCFERLAGKSWFEYAEDKQLRKNSAGILRAAERYCQASSMYLQLEAIKAQVENLNFTDARSRLNRSIELLNKTQSHLSMTYSGVTKKKNSKRLSIRGKPDNWIFEVVRNIAPGLTQLASLVMALTGCRPAELINGVELRIHGSNLLVRIKGAKVSDITQGGQPERLILLDGTQRGPNVIIFWLRKKDWDSFKFRIRSYNAFYYAVKKSAKSLSWGELSPYSFRQQLAANLKSQGQNDDVLSKVLGHRSSRSKSAYGHANQGWYRGSRGRSPILAVKATYSVRNYEAPTFGLEPSSGPTLH